MASRGTLCPRWYVKGTSSLVSSGKVDGTANLMLHGWLVVDRSPENY